MSLHPAVRGAVGASAALVLACGSPTEPNTEIVVGTIDPSSVPPRSSPPRRKCERAPRSR